VSEENPSPSPVTEKGFQFTFEQRLRGMPYLNLFRESGRVSKVLGPIVEGTLPGAVVGGICRILQRNQPDFEAEIVGFRGRTALLMPLREPQGIAMGARIEQIDQIASVQVGNWMVGKLINGYGREVGGAQQQASFEIGGLELRPIRAPALDPLHREPISKRLFTGVRAIDAAIPVGMGQRLAIMAASGVGKSVLMGMIARQSTADVNVICLVGERGREVTEFLERDLGPAGLKKSVVVAVTSDEAPVLKVRGAYLATTIAEFFRDQGLNCLLMMDSVTRFAMAAREIGLSAGEPPTTKGYTPSVFAQLPKLLERAGAKRSSGCITGLYTVLVEGNDFDDPIADAVRSIVDGHIVLSRPLAHKNHYPAIDVLESVSRLIHAVASPQDALLNGQIREAVATYREAEDLINIGGYRKGNNPKWDRAIELYPKIIEFLRQASGEPSSLDKNRAALEEIFRS
jgi:flagellum-specific ATP synthase